MMTENNSTTSTKNSLNNIPSPSQQSTDDDGEDFGDEKNNTLEEESSQKQYSKSKPCLVAQTDNNKANNIISVKNVTGSNITSLRNDMRTCTSTTVSTPGINKKSTNSTSSTNRNCFPSAFTSKDIKNSNNNNNKFLKGDSQSLQKQQHNQKKTQQHQHHLASSATKTVADTKMHAGIETETEVEVEADVDMVDIDDEADGDLLSNDVHKDTKEVCAKFSSVLKRNRLDDDKDKVDEYEDENMKGGELKKARSKACVLPAKASNTVVTSKKLKEMIGKKSSNSLKSNETSIGEKNVINNTKIMSATTSATATTSTLDLHRVKTESTSNSTSNKKTTSATKSLSLKTTSGSTNSTNSKKTESSNSTHKNNGLKKGDVKQKNNNANSVIHADGGNSAATTSTSTRTENAIPNPNIVLNPISEWEEPIEVPSLTLFDMHRRPRKVKTDASIRIGLPLKVLMSEFQCPICLGYMKKTAIVMECLHRFCGECIQKYLRLGKKECPSCRIHIPTRRSLRPDPTFDLLIQKIYGDLDALEKKVEKEIEEMNKLSNMNNAYSESRKRGIMHQAKHRRKRQNPNKVNTEDNNNNDRESENKETPLEISDLEESQLVSFYLRKHPHETLIDRLQREYIRTSHELTIGQLKLFLSRKLDYPYTSHFQILGVSGGKGVILDNTISLSDLKQHVQDIIDDEMILYYRVINE